MALYQYPVEGVDDDEFHFGNFHGVMEMQPWEMPVQSFQVPGVLGVAHLVDMTKSRHIACEIRWQGYETYALLESAIAALDAFNGVLRGTVYFTGPLEGAFPKCTFIGFERTSKARYDGSGLNGWWIEGRLHWIQRTQ